jgi:gentisate 1,2-dioxygenase
MNDSNPMNARSDGDAFHKLIHENSIYGLWEIASQMTPHPRPEAIPHQWKWSLLERLVRESSVAVPVGDERRAMQLFNPGLNGQWASTSTLIAAVQVLLPGEVARAHRHSPAAIRFIMQGNGAYTAVEGEKVVMHEGDLVLTPSWLWHDMAETKEAVWMDGRTCRAASAEHVLPDGRRSGVRQTGECPGALRHARMRRPGSGVPGSRR